MISASRCCAASSEHIGSAAGRHLRLFRGGVIPAGRDSVPGSRPAPVPSTPHTPGPRPRRWESIADTSHPSAPRVTQRKPGWALDRIDQRRLPWMGGSPPARGRGSDGLRRRRALRREQRRIRWRGSVGRASGETCVWRTASTTGFSSPAWWPVAGPGSPSRRRSCRSGRATVGAATGRDRGPEDCAHRARAQLGGPVPRQRRRESLAQHGHTLAHVHDRRRAAHRGRHHRSRVRRQ